MLLARCELWLQLSCYLCHDFRGDYMKSYIDDRYQFVKLGRHSSEIVRCNSGMAQGSVLEPLIFAAYVSWQCVLQPQVPSCPHSKLVREPSNAGPPTTTCCWTLTNPRQCSSGHHESSITTCKHRHRLPVSSAIKSLGVVIESRLTFDVTVVCRPKACNYHACALRRIIVIGNWHAECTDIQHVGAPLDYCNSVL